MHVNVGNLDRFARIPVGLVLPSLPFWLATPRTWPGPAGLMPLFTGLAGRCPAHRLPGRTRCRLHEPE